MPTQCISESFVFSSVEGRRVVAGFDGGVVTTDAGALLLGAADRAIGLIDRFAACFVDGRERGHVVHDVKALVRQRVFGIALGYEDVNDHDELRFDDAEPSGARAGGRGWAVSQGRPRRRGDRECVRGSVPGCA